MDLSEQDRQNRLAEAKSFIGRAMTASQKDFKTVLEYRYVRWNLTMKAIYALLRSLKIHPDEIDRIGDTVNQASAGGWTVT